jgi:hypothetical protein
MNRLSVIFPANSLENLKNYQSWEFWGMLLSILCFAFLLYIIWMNILGKYRHQR